MVKRIIKTIIATAVGFCVGGWGGMIITNLLLGDVTPENPSAWAMFMLAFFIFTAAAAGFMQWRRG